VEEDQPRLEVLHSLSELLVLTHHGLKLSSRFLRDSLYLFKKTRLLLGQSGPQVFHFLPKLTHEVSCEQMFERLVLKWIGYIGEGVVCYELRSLREDRVLRACGFNVLFEMLYFLCYLPPIVGSKRTQRVCCEVNL